MTIIYQFQKLDLAKGRWRTSRRWGARVAILRLGENFRILEQTATDIDLVQLPTDSPGFTPIGFVPGSPATITLADEEETQPLGASSSWLYEARNFAGSAVTALPRIHAVAWLCRLFRHIPTEVLSAFRESEAVATRNRSIEANSSQPARQNAAEMIFE